MMAMELLLTAVLPLKTGDDSVMTTMRLRSVQVRCYCRVVTLCLSLLFWRS